MIVALILHHCYRNVDRLRACLCCFCTVHIFISHFEYSRIYNECSNILHCCHFSHFDQINTFLLLPCTKSDEKYESECPSGHPFNFKSGGEVVSSVGNLPGAAWTLVEVMGWRRMVGDLDVMRWNSDELNLGIGRDKLEVNVEEEPFHTEMTADSSREQHSQSCWGCLTYSLGVGQ